MTVVVMCDGAPASVKAIGWASMPGNLMHQHDGEQLILLHAWSREPPQRAASPKDSPEKAAPLPDDPMSMNRLPFSQVLKKTLETITESKVTRDSLNYKLETMILGDPVLPAAVPQSTPSSPTPAKSSKKEPASPPQPPVTLTEEEIQAAAREGALMRANTIAMYAKERALHHKAEAILLGSGNSIDGKNIILGLVSKTVLRELRQEHVLWFMKGNGCTIRPNTMMVRYVVVLVPESNNEEALERDCRVVQYALARCRKNTMDTVSSVVVVENSTLPEDVERYSQALKTLLDKSTRVPNSPTVEEPVSAVGDAPSDAAAPPSPLPLEKVEATTTTTTNNNNNNNSDATAHETVPNTSGEVLPAAEGVDDGPEEKQWPEVSICQLRTTKQVAVPTAANAPSQVVKFLQRHKTDVVVSPSTLPEELHMALLSMSKPHVLVLPSGDSRPSSVAELRTPIKSAGCTE